MLHVHGRTGVRGRTSMDPREGTSSGCYTREGARILEKERHLDTTLVNSHRKEHGPKQKRDTREGTSFAYYSRILIQKGAWTQTDKSMAAVDLEVRQVAGGDCRERWNRQAGGRRISRLVWGSARTSGLGVELWWGGRSGDGTRCEGSCCAWRNLVQFAPQKDKATNVHETRARIDNLEMLQQACSRCRYAGGLLR